MAEPFVYLSLGAGVESSAMLAMSCFGARGVPRAEVAIFSDTQDEPAWVYDQLSALETLSTIPIIRVTVGRLSKSRILRIPAFVRNDDGGVGPLTQNCTRDYKRTPIRRTARRMMKDREIRSAICLLGISVGEAHRMKPSHVKWLTHSHPLIDAGMTKSGCATYLRSVGWPVPRKSACVYCPWRSDKNWRELKEFDPVGFMRAAEFDERIYQQRGARVHKSMIPLAQIDFTDNQIEMFGNDCEGTCGV